MSARVAIVVPTRNRATLVLRLVRYLADRGFGGQVIVADASEPADRAVLERHLSAENALRLDLMPFAPDAHWAKRIVEAIKRVETPFVSLCGDDDFVVPESAEFAARFLEDHPDYSIAHGHAAACFAADGRLFSSTYRQRAIEGSDPVERLRDHLSKYSATFYSLHRRHDLQRNLELTHEHAPDYRFGEILPSSLSAVQGKVACLDVLYVVRQDQPTSHGKIGPNWTKTMMAPEFSTQLTTTQRVLVDELVRVGVERSAAINGVEEALERYMVSMLSREFPDTRPRSLRWLQEGLAVVRPVARALTEGLALSIARDPTTAWRTLKREARRGEPDLMAPMRVSKPGHRFSAELTPIFELLRRYPNGMGV